MRSITVKAICTLLVTVLVFCLAYFAMRAMPTPDPTVPSTGNQTQPSTAPSTSTSTVPTTTTQPTEPTEPTEPTTQPTVHSHSFGQEWQTDEDFHWHECPCGERTNLAEHIDEDVNTQCDICGAYVPPPPHVHQFSTTWVSDDTNHWNVCECGALENVAEHFDTDLDTNCDVCGAFVPLPPHEHDFGEVWAFDSKNHWHLCQCGEVADFQAHADADEDDFCDVCAADLTMPTHTHNYGTIWKSDETYHWHQCLCGQRSEQAEHVDADQNTKCDICFAFVPPPPHQHTFLPEWLYNEAGHWQLCECGDPSETEAHADLDGNHRCDTCGYVVSLPNPPTLHGTNAFIFDCETNDYTYNTSDSYSTKVYPASITKIFTCYVALKYLSLDEEILLGEEQSMYAYDASTAGFRAGQTVSVNALLHGTLMASGSDAVFGLAVAAGRKILNNSQATAQAALDAFINEMNHQAQLLGMGPTNFVTPDGIHANAHAISFHAFVTIARCAMDNDTILSICGKATATVTYKNSSGSLRSITFRNTNSLLQADSSYYIPECIGLKTGYTKAAGRCFLGLFYYNGKYVIIGIFGCANSNGRWQDMVNLWEYYKELDSLT